MRNADPSSVAVKFVVVIESSNRDCIGRGYRVENLNFSVTQEVGEAQALVLRLEGLACALEVDLRGKEIPSFPSIDCQRIEDNS